jgi:hypothetical protein
MLVKAVKILTNISADPATKGAFVDSGALAFLIWALQAYPAETQLMEQVLITVGNAATHPDGLIAVRDGSGIQAAVYLLATHADPSTGGSLAVAIAALGVLAAVAIDEYSKVIIRTCDGIPHIVGLLYHQGSSEAELTRRASSALINLSTDNDNKTAITECGGFAALVAVLSAFSTNPALIKQICWAMSNVVSKSDFARGALREAGGFPVLVSVLQQSESNNAIVLEAVSRVVRYALSGDDANKDTFIASGGVKVIAGCIMNQLSTPGSTAQTMEALAGAGVQIVSVPSGAGAFRESNGAALLVSALQKWIASGASVVTTLAQAITILAGTDAAAKDQLRLNQAGPLLDQALRTKPGDATLQEVVSIAMQLFAVSNAPAIQHAAPIPAKPTLAHVQKTFVPTNVAATAAAAAAKTPAAAARGPAQSGGYSSFFDPSKAAATLPPPPAPNFRR